MAFFSAYTADNICIYENVVEPLYWRNTVDNCSVLLDISYFLFSP